ncbi:MAG: hypothetical protein P8182_11835 [Deltaproteobacteria bacterium]
MANFAFPILNLLDRWLSFILPWELARICFWGLLCAASSMTLYAWLSDQKGVAELKDEAKKLRSAIMDPEVEESEFRRMMRQNLLVSGRLLGKVFAPAVLSSLPSLLIILWLSTYQSYALPAPGSSVGVEAVPSSECLVAAPGDILKRNDNGLSITVGEKPRSIRFVKCGHLAYQGNPFVPPTAEIGRWAWWNVLWASQAGYVRPDSGLESLFFHFPRKEFLKGLHPYLSSWEFPFFVTLLVVSVAVKFGFRIE